MKPTFHHPSPANRRLAMLAARVFHLTAQELSDPLDTFEALRRNGERTLQKFRTKRLILEAITKLP